MAGKDEIQSEGRRENAAQPLSASDNARGAERYPAVRQDDAVEAEPRAFGKVGNPEPRQGAGDATVPPSAKASRMGPGGDPSEGKPR
ncbi:hypothetical protein [Phenylobacterium sp.]|uniref:hypothetical protein n=1 Tax=Phenylobacterium sp. TaxID=1871053 RepID=UPI003918DA67